MNTYLSKKTKMKKSYTTPHIVCIAADTLLPLATSDDETPVKPGETEEQYSKDNSFFDKDAWEDDDE